MCCIAYSVLCNGECAVQHTECYVMESVLYSIVSYVMECVLYSIQSVT